MATLADILNDRRGRNLAILAGAAIVTIAIAFIALSGQNARTADNESGELFFPQLRIRSSDVAKIHIVSAKDGTFDVAFLPDRGWVIPSRGNFPASFDQVKRTVTGLSEFTKIEPKTAKPELLHYVDLEDPAKGGKGIEIVLTSEKGETIAALILGKSEDIGDSTGAVGLYVRGPSSSQSWLVRSMLDLQSDPAQWMEKDIVGLDRSRIKEVSVAPKIGPAFMVRRDKPSDANFALLDMPKGRELAYESATDAVASALTGFSFSDVRPETPGEFDNAARLTADTFDGLSVTADVVKSGADTWVRISAEAASGAKPDIEKEARQIAAKAGGWAFKLPAYKADQFQTTRDSLLKPLENAKPAG